MAIVVDTMEKARAIMADRNATIGERECAQVYLRNHAPTATRGRPQKPANAPVIQDPDPVSSESEEHAPTATAPEQTEAMEDQVDENGDPVYGVDTDGPITFARFEERPADALVILESAKALTPRGADLVRSLTELAVEMGVREQRQTAEAALAAVRARGWSETPEEFAALEADMADRTRRQNEAALGNGPTVTGPDGVTRTPEQYAAGLRKFGIE